MAKKKKKQKAYNPAMDDGTSRPIRAAVAIGDPQDKYSEYPSSGLSPRRLAEIFREADEGNVLRQMELFEEMEEKDNNFEVVCQNLLEVLIINMVRRTKANLLIAPAKKVAKECRFVEQYINNHFREEISLELLSEKAFMNKFYLVHAFKQYKGISPINYLIQLRIKEAKELLSTTNYSISQISESSGFSSQSYFSQVFKKETGMMQNEYRKTVH